MVQPAAAGEGGGLSAFTFRARRVQSVAEAARRQDSAGAKRKQAPNTHCPGGSLHVNLETGKALLAKDRKMRFLLIAGAGILLLAGTSFAPAQKKKEEAKKPDTDTQIQEVGGK